MLNIIKTVFLAIIIIIVSTGAYAEKKKPGGMPPAIVVVTTAESGMIAPESEFVGTVYYKEVSEVAAEVSGKVEEVSFEDGQLVKEDSLLVRLDSDLLHMSINSARANYEQTVANLKKARLDLNRSEQLFKEELASEQDYDKERFNVEALELKAVSLDADVKRLEIELEKKAIKAPFEGIVIKRDVDKGEWLSPGSVVATIAKNTPVDIISEVPETIINGIRANMEVTVVSGGKTLKGTVVTVIPRGNVSTRTFPVKVRVDNSTALKEGMEARVTLPTGAKTKVVTVHRDAVITARGSTVVYTVNESKASMIPVRVIGYDGMTAGIAANGLKEGMKIVIKGNERLRPGQDVMIQQ